MDIYLNVSEKKNCEKLPHITAMIKWYGNYERLQESGILFSERCRMGCVADLCYYKR